MSDVGVCVDAVLPLFIIMGLGYAARRLGAIRREDVPRLNKMAFRFFLPVLLFYNIYTSDLSSAVQPKLLLFGPASVRVRLPARSGRGSRLRGHVGFGRCAYVQCARGNNAGAV